MDVKKRERSSNWTEQEKVLFGNVKGSGQSVKDREGVWAEIANTVNAAGNIIRNKDQVKKQFDNIKQQVKKYLDLVRHPPTGGGRGPSPPTIAQNLLIEHWKGRPGMGGLSAGIDTEDPNLADVILETMTLSSVLEIDDAVQNFSTALETIASFPTSASLGPEAFPSTSTCQGSTHVFSKKKSKKRLAMTDLEEAEAERARMETEIAYWQKKKTEKLMEQ